VIRRGGESVLLCVAACLTLMMSTGADARRGAGFAASWTTEPEPTSSEVRVVRPGDVIAAARLTPSGLFVLEGEAKADGLSLATGTPLILLDSNVPNAHIGCTYTFVPRGIAASIMFGSKQKFFCLVDADRDGRFESFFSIASLKIGVPPMAGIVPDQRTTISPVAYREGDVAARTDYPRLLIKYSHRDQITGIAYIGLCLANPTTKSQPCVDSYNGVRDSKVPKTVELAGASIDVIAKDGAALTIRVTKPMERAPFVGIETTRYGY